MSTCGDGRGRFRFLRLDPRHPHWPPLWRHLDRPPSLVTVAGQSRHLGRRALAVVGTRRATPRGLVIAEALAGELARAGWVIVSGLARGIDAAAHRGALMVGGDTVAIMATGCDLTYPAAHVGLRRRIESHGCVVTEESDGTRPQKYHFPKRNRLIAGLAEGVLVIEAPRQSGALLTAYLALELGREVLAVPGPIDRPESHGCHHLIKEGAALVGSAADIHEVLSPPVSPAGMRLACEPDRERSGWPAAAPDLRGAARWIWDRLDLEGRCLQELRDGWPGEATAWTEGLLGLEMAGLIRRLPGGRLARRIWRP